MYYQGTIDFDMEKLISYSMNYDDRISIIILLIFLICFLFSIFVVYRFYRKKKKRNSKVIEKINEKKDEISKNAGAMNLEGEFNIEQITNIKETIKEEEERIIN